MRLENTHIFLPNNFDQSNLTLNLNVNLEEVCNGVVNPTTNKTMTAYKKVIACPELQEVWLKAMCKELGNITQGYKEGDKINVNFSNAVASPDLDNSNQTRRASGLTSFRC